MAYATEHDARWGRMDAELQRLQDRLDLADLVSRLGLWLDEARFDEASAIFTDDVTVATAGGTSAGIDRVVAQARRNHTRRTQHIVTNALIQLDGDAAEVQANLVVRFARDDAVAEPSLTLGERYRLSAVRVPHGWRLRHVATELIWKDGELPAGARPAA